MSDFIIASIVFVCCLGGALIGLVLPVPHRDADSKDTVKLVMGLVATMSALVLGLLIATAKSSYDAQLTSVQEIAADMIQLDQRLARFGPETRAIRTKFRNDALRVRALIWSPQGGQAAALDPTNSARELEAIRDDRQDLVPKTNAQQDDRAKALELLSTIRRSRILTFVAMTNQIPLPLLIVLVLWVMALFIGFGLFARFNLTVMLSLLIGALSIAAAIFLILELNHPYSGLLRISDTPIQYALSLIRQ